MMNDMPGSSTCRRFALIAMLSLSVSACAMHWPWTRRPPPPPQPVHQVTIAPDAPASAAAIIQYWDRNTLLLDLSSVDGEGGAAITPIKALGWPVRLEFRVQPGSIGRLEVLAAQRVVFEVPSQGAPLLLKLAPGAYLADSAQITIRWSAAAGSAH
ncbi:MAG: hypothetical protein ACHQDD_07775 [Steroidobacterales bacterium]